MDAQKHRALQCKPTRNDRSDGQRRISRDVSENYFQAVQNNLQINCKLPDKQVSPPVRTTHYHTRPPLRSYIAPLSQPQRSRAWRLSGRAIARRRGVVHPAVELRCCKLGNRTLLLSPTI